jgi:hypothetical protein
MDEGRNEVGNQQELLIADGSKPTQATETIDLRAAPHPNELSPATGEAMRITLYYYEYVANSLGVWNREWFASKSEARKARREKWRSLGGRRNTGTGEYGDVSRMLETQVEPSAEGILDFAQNFALAED